MQKAPEIPLSKEERRIKRQERRDKQRLANVGRAEKMHAARLAPQTNAATPAKDKCSPPLSNLHVGCSGWFYWHWRGGFYLWEMPTSAWFEHYASQFDTVELNAPFYSWPTLGAIQTWVQQAGERRFTYTVKVSELITHVKRFTGTKTLVQDFGYIADLLGERFGCFLFQLPPSFRYTPAALRRIVSQLDPARRNVVEFRHRDWWNQRVFDAFREAGIIFCSCSGPRLPDEVVKTADDIYIRFHGPTKWYQHDYTPQELAIWAEKIRSCGVSRVWAYFNNDRNCHAIENARTLRLQLSPWFT